MTYKHQAHPEIVNRENLLLARKQVTLKIIPGIDGTPEIAQLIGITFENVTVEGAWIGNARLDLTPSVNCTLADLPVHQVTVGVHLVTSMTLPYGHLLHDYLA